MDLRDRRPLVRHSYAREALRHLDADLDRTVALCVAHRVRQQVRQRAPQHQMIGAYRGAAAAMQAQAAFRRDRLEELDQCVDFRIQRHRLPLRHQESVVGLREVQHVGHHARQPLVLFEVGEQDFAVFLGRADTRQRHLGLCRQVGDRRAQLMRQIGREVGQAHEGFLQTREHRVELLGQFVELARHALQLQTLVQVRGGDLARHARDILNRLQRAACDQAAQHRHGEHRQADHPEQATVEGAQKLLVMHHVDRQGHPHRWFAGNRGTGERREAAHLHAVHLPAVQLRLARLDRENRHRAVVHRRKHLLAAAALNRQFQPVVANQRVGHALGQLVEIGG